MHPRGLGAFLIALTMATLSCSDDPAPLTGQAFWVDGCVPPIVNANCATAQHSLRGARGGAVSTSCSVETVGSGQYAYSMELVVGDNIDESTEGIIIDVTAGGLNTAATAGRLFIAGLGWRSGVSLGPTSPCKVELTRVSGKSIAGRFQCTGVSDSLVPPNQRYVRGASPLTQDTDWAEFSFSNCD